MKNPILLMLLMLLSLNPLVRAECEYTQEEAELLILRGLATKMDIDLGVFECIDLSNENIVKPLDLLSVATVHNHHEIFDALIDAGADVNKPSDYYATPPLHFATMPEYSSSHFVQELLENGAEVDARNSNGQTALHFAAEYGADSDGSLEPVRLLLAHGADVNAQDNEGDTPLHGILKNPVAIWLDNQLSDILLERLRGFNGMGEEDSYKIKLDCEWEAMYRMVEVLIDGGADLTLKNNAGETPLDTFTAMIERENSISLNRESTPSEQKLTKYLALQQRAQSVGGLHQTVIEICEGNAPFSDLEALFEYGADANALDANGNTALHVVFDSLKPIECEECNFVINGNVAAYREFYDALEFAIKIKSYVFHYLVSKGTDRLALNNLNKSALDKLNALAMPFDAIPMDEDCVKALAKTGSNPSEYCHSLSKYMFDSMREVLSDPNIGIKWKR